MKYRITPIDPLISRDARPFGAGGRVRSLDWLTQTATTGVVRTALWKRLENPDSNEDLKALLDVQIRGPFPLLDDKLYFQRPLDIVVSAKGTYPIKPVAIPKGCHVEMPVDGLLPAAPDTNEDFKPEKLKPFWTRELMARWLENGVKSFELSASETISAPAQDERIHVNIDPDTGAARDGQLFSTAGLDFVRGKPKGLRYGHAAVDITIPDGLPNLDERFTAPLGGERRLAEFEKHDGDENLWDCPLSLKFQEGDKIRLVLASPAIFSQGWLPGWIDKASLEGTIPGTETRIKLISAVTGRWQAISGWGYKKDKRGPKPLRRAVPAGSLYFFEVTGGTFNTKDMWLRPVCDDEQDRKDGFGLALWGKGEW